MAYYILADLDAFYASVEQLDNPQYRGKPVIVGGLTNDRRSVVSTASYEARKFGVHSAMPIVQAAKLCPDGIFVRCNMDRYKEKSKEVMALFSNFSPDVQQISIDEAFIDITGTEKLFGPYPQTAEKIKKTVREKTGLTVSLGLASNKYVAKIAAGMSKPDGLSVVEPGGEEDFMLSLPITKIWGAGDKTQEEFKRHGLKSCADIHRLSLETLTGIFGDAQALFLYRAVRGEAASAFGEREKHSISGEQTFSYDITDEAEIESALFALCQKLMRRLLTENMQSGTVCIKIRYADFSTESAQKTESIPVRTAKDLYGRVKNLFYIKYQKGRAVRLIGAGLMNIKEADIEQGELFSFGDEKTKKLEECIHTINKKFPAAALKKARLI
jgi:DNA polymerase-4